MREGGVIEGHLMEEGLPLIMTKGKLAPAIPVPTALRLVYIRRANRSSFFALIMN